MESIVISSRSPQEYIIICVYSEQSWQNIQVYRTSRRLFMTSAFYNDNLTKAAFFSLQQSDNEVTDWKSKLNTGICYGYH